MVLPPSAPQSWRIAAENPSFQSRYDAVQRLVDFPSYQWWRLSDIFGQRHIYLDQNLDYTKVNEDYYWYMIDQMNIRAQNLYRLIFDVEYPEPEYDFNSDPLNTGATFRNFAYERGKFTSYEITELFRQQVNLRDARSNAPTFDDYLKSILKTDEYQEYVYWAQGQQRTSSSYISRVGRFTAQAGVVVGGVLLGSVAAPAIGAAVGGTGVAATESVPVTSGFLDGLSITAAEASGYVTAGATVVNQGKGLFDQIQSFINPKKDESTMQPQPETAVSTQKSFFDENKTYILAAAGALTLLLVS